MDRVKQFLSHKSEKSSVQFLRYGVVAAIGLVVDFGGLILLKQYAHLFYLEAATVSFLVALIVNYFLSMWFVFPKSRHSRWNEFLMFGAIGLVGLGLNDLLIWLLTSGLGIFYVTSKAVSTVIVFVWNFLARKAFFAMRPMGSRKTIDATD